VLVCVQDVFGRDAFHGIRCACVQTHPAQEVGVSYWQLMSGRAFGCVVSGTAPIVLPSEHRVVGHYARRIDIEDKALGVQRFVHGLSRRA
jgi:hypothetical protein